MAPTRVIWPEDLLGAIAGLKRCERTFARALDDPACDDVPRTTRLELLQSARRLRQRFERELARRSALQARIRRAASRSGILKFPERPVH